MNQFNNGKIYKIVDNTCDKIYIGSTIQTLRKRLWHHQSDFRLNHNVSSRYILQNNDYNMELIECFPCESKSELTKREQLYMSLYGERCVNLKKAFLTDEQRDRSFKDYYIRNKETLLAKKTERNKIYHECDCGGRYNTAHRSRHFRTNKHLNYFSNVTNKDETDN